MSASKPQKSGEVRIEHSLNEKEEEFVARRRNAVLQSLNKLKIHLSQDEVPNIALLGSGGGQRAMVGLLGSLVQLQKTGLLDCILYLSGVSGSTWCMASLYQDPNWSTELETVKDKIIQRLSSSKVSWTDAFAKLKKYYSEKDEKIFSLTDVFAAMVITTYVKEIDEHTLTDQWDQQSKDPFPIYMVIDKHCKQNNDGDPWFEFTPYEAGYSLTGAFVETSSFGSKFENGCKIKDQPEIDMLYLQEDPTSLPEDECYKVLMDLVDMNLSVLNGKDPSALDESIRTKLNKLNGGKRQMVQAKKMNLTDKKTAKQYMEQYTEDVYNDLNRCFSFWPKNIWTSIIKCLVDWIWGRNYDFLHNMKDKAVPSTLLESETRDYEDAGLLINSPYFSVLRKERDIDLIISLDFSEVDPFKVELRRAEASANSSNLKAHEEAACLNPSFWDKIEEWRKTYSTSKWPYSDVQMITDLMEVAGKNILNNEDNLLEQIHLAIKIHK
ncbi:Cytosolic phospholipase A2 gamma [Anabarilius grahami]|uniref:Cytosolic phospholipase A2 gamma n=1 Tax=Anabarilius grahami TaxID=495550 RepID=A0A3N0Z6H0_ANAGA|nr:Cytosolic phospholipase A2 gamma [Anabarilius grahami]